MADLIHLRKKMLDLTKRLLDHQPQIDANQARAQESLAAAGLEMVRCIDASLADRSNSQQLRRTAVAANTNKTAQFADQQLRRMLLVRSRQMLNRYPGAAWSSAQTMLFERMLSQIQSIDVRLEGRSADPLSIQAVRSLAKPRRP